MFAFRIVLFALAVGLNIYSWIVMYDHGWNLFPVIVSDITALNWNGQFDFDLLCFIFLSGFWIAWRHKFKTPALFLGVFGGFLGTAFFLPYLLFLTYKTKGDVRLLLLGERS